MGATRNCSQGFEGRECDADGAWCCEVDWLWHCEGPGKSSHQRSVYGWNMFYCFNRIGTCVSYTYIYSIYTHIIYIYVYLYRQTRVLWSPHILEACIRLHLMAKKMGVFVFSPSCQVQGMPRDIKSLRTMWELRSSCLKRSSKISAATIARTSGPWDAPSFKSWAAVHPFMTGGAKSEGERSISKWNEKHMCIKGWIIWIGSTQILGG